MNDSAIGFITGVITVWLCYLLVKTLEWLTKKETATFVNEQNEKEEYKNTPSSTVPFSVPLRDLVIKSTTLSTVPITVNGKTLAAIPGKLPYETLLKAAGHDPARHVTITWYRKETKNCESSGILHFGEVLDIRGGEVITIMHTGNA